MRGAFEERGVRIIGVSRDASDAQQAFCDKYGLGFAMLTDPEHRVHDAYGAWGDRPGRGEGVIRSTFVIGADGRIEGAWYGVTPDGHASEVLAAL